MLSASPCVFDRSSPALRSPSLAVASLTLTAPARADSQEVEALGRGAAAVARGDYALAEKEYASVRAGSKERAEAQLSLARIQLLTGRFAEVEKTAKAAASGGKEARAEAAALRGAALAAQGKTAEAITVLKEVEALDEARRARLLLGEILIRTGKRAEAKAPLLSLVQDYNDDKITAQDAVGLSMVGRAAHLLRSPRDANEAYNAAEKAGAKKLVETLLWRAELFLDKYDPGHAGEVVKEALKLAPGTLSLT